jgi:hypothetical protein
VEEKQGSVWNSVQWAVGFLSFLAGVVAIYPFVDAVAIGIPYDAVNVMNDIRFSSGKITWIYARFIAVLFLIPSLFVYPPTWNILKGRFPIKESTRTILTVLCAVGIFTMLAIAFVVLTRVPEQLY